MQFMPTYWFDALECFAAMQRLRCTPGRGATPGGLPEAQTLAKLAQLRLAHWWRTGWHEEFGEVTQRQQASYFAAHEVTHLSQIEALRPSYYNRTCRQRALSLSKGGDSQE